MVIRVIKALDLENMTDTAIIDSHKAEKNQLWIRILSSLFYTPGEAFDLYLNHEKIQPFSLYKTHIYFCLIAVIFRLFSIGLMSLVDPTIQPKTYLKGGLVSFLTYFACFLLFIQVDRLRASYCRDQQKVVKSILVISFLPVSASAVFQLIPGYIAYIFFSFAWLHSLYLAYISLRLYANFSKKDYLAFLLYIGIFFLVILLFLAIGVQLINYYAFFQSH